MCYAEISDLGKLVHMLNDGYRLPKPLISSTELWSLTCRCWLVKPETRPRFDNIHSILANYAGDSDKYIEIGLSKSDTSSRSKSERLPSANTTLIVRNRGESLSPDIAKKFIEKPSNVVKDII